MHGCRARFGLRRRGQKEENCQFIKRPFSSGVEVDKYFSREDAVTTPSDFINTSSC